MMQQARTPPRTNRNNDTTTRLQVDVCPRPQRPDDAGICGGPTHPLRLQLLDEAGLRISGGGVVVVGMLNTRGRERKQHQTSEPRNVTKTTEQDGRTRCSATVCQADGTKIASQKQKQSILLRFEKPWRGCTEHNAIPPFKKKQAWICTPRTSVEGSSGVARAGLPRTELSRPPP